jgi:hypothetical protein
MTSAIGRRPVQPQLAVVRVILDEVERSLTNADLSQQSGLSDQLADALETLALALRQQTHFTHARKGSTTCCDFDLAARPAGITKPFAAEGDGIMHLSCQSRCSWCGSSYDTAQWPALRLVSRLSAEEVASYVISWPSHAVIEVRVCARCGRTISHATHQTQYFATISAPVSKPWPAVRLEAEK